ncbi:class I SAM-dependent methyltransferase [Hymenobacter setariae]|uniref:Class I SAM-dependent methyltransferase n=1 Tax=Hymenobacter setariae TaxID=2594794 RepID=A0A558C4A6_9BACT|nr:class I SAM-dependent methyltransferase [Hymenobacter setariae]TVT43633.1 class I SAM-dependent methyltransferase [Hymenobacter setariae]
MASSTIPSPSPSADFSRVARVYDALAGAVFGRAQRAAQQAALAAGMPLAGSAPRVLVLGGGSGWVLLELLRQCPAAQVLYLETSTTMLAQAQARLQQAAPGTIAQVEFRQGSEQALAPTEQFDAVVTFFVLDCFTLAEFPAALACLQAARRPRAPWLIADFRPPRTWWQRVLLRAMYLFFKLTVGLRAQQLPPWPAALAALGLQNRYQESFYGDFIWCRVMQ